MHTLLIHSLPMILPLDSAMANITRTAQIYLSVSFLHLPEQWAYKRSKAHLLQQQAPAAMEGI